jgi:hypothetical protein
LREFGHNSGCLSRLCLAGQKGRIVIRLNRGEFAEKGAEDSAGAKPEENHEKGGPKWTAETFFGLSWALIKGAVGHDYSNLP